MKIAIASYEVFPFAKVGGLADVVGSLPKALRELEEVEEVVVFMPKHKIVDKNAEKYKYSVEPVKGGIPVSVLKTNEKFDILKSKIPGSDVTVYMIANNYYYSSEKVYEGPDPAEPEIFFSAAVLYALKELDFKPDVLHVNDWHTALIPVYLKTVFRDDPFFEGIATVLTLHNIGAPYQGRIDKSYMEFAGLPDYLYNIDGLEFYGQINLLKGGILFADVINTVSPTYAQEIQTEEFGNGLEGVLKVRSADLYGILNGIDMHVYDPLLKEAGYETFDIKDYDKKKPKNKETLRKEFGLEPTEAPLIGMITRLVDQKGLDLVYEIFDYIMLLGAQFIVLGTGEKKYEDMFIEMAKKYPGQVSANITFNNELAAKIYASSDMFLMPSRYEPCGLGQMFAMRYGTVPIVRYTGGLADSVKEYNEENKDGTGFGFTLYDSAHLLKSIAKAVYYYYSDDWDNIVKNALSQDFSWSKSAKEYLELYKTAMNKIKS